MKPDPIGSGKRKPVNLSLDTGVVEAVRAAGLNLSQISEAARKDHDRRWKEENREWIAAHQRWVADNELPLERYRLF